MTELVGASVKVAIPDEKDVAPVVTLLKCGEVNDLLNFFRIDGSQVVAEIELRKHYGSLERTFPVFAKVVVDQGAVVWLLGFDHPEVYLQVVEVQNQGKGIGPRQFAQLARKFAAAQYTHVTTWGVRTPLRKQDPSAKEFGYNALPKWGFDGPIPESSKNDLPTSHSQMGDRSIRELLATNGGDQVWKDVGESCKLTFDLINKSRSWQVLANRIGQDLPSAQGL